MDLPQEQFKAMTELAEINVSISKGRAALSQLKVDTEKYLELRETAAHERVEKVLKESHEALKSTTQNQEELHAYAKDLSHFTLELAGFSQEIVTLFHDFTERVAATDAALDIRLEEARSIEKRCTIERANITEDRKQLARERNALSDEKRLLTDRQQMLAKTAEYIKKLQGKNSL